MSDRWMDRLSEYLDGELAEGERVTLEAHLQSCEACTEVLEQLRGVVTRARTLGGMAPEQDLWPAIAQRIGATPSKHQRRELSFTRSSSRRWSFSLPQLAAAAITLMTLSGGAVWLARGPETPAAVTRVATQPPRTVPAITAAAALPQAKGDSSYSRAVADLEQVLAAGRGQLDSSTVRVIEQNLAAIDRAIAQARAALEADPANLYLNTHLAETMRRKLDLLRQAAALASVS